MLPVFASPSTRALAQKAVHLAKFDVPILLLGETGTGKEVFANLIHGNSPRAAGTKIALNCAAIPADLIESELFGAQRGAFSGAAVARLGLFRAASGGTLFLDELAEMPAQAQSKLLRALQTSRVRSLGSDNEEYVDVRIVAATNVEPQAAIKSGKLRADLYYRLSAFTLTVPPLRTRPEDLEELSKRFLAAEAAKHKLPAPRLSADAITALYGHLWPGNVRELFGVLARALLMHAGQPEICALDIDGLGVSQAPETCLETAGLKAAWAEAGNITQFGEALGIGRDAARAKLKALGITTKSE